MSTTAEWFFKMKIVLLWFILAQSLLVVLVRAWNHFSIRHYSISVFSTKESFFSCQDCEKDTGVFMLFYDFVVPGLPHNYLQLLIGNFNSLCSDGMLVSAERRRRKN